MANITTNPQIISQGVAQTRYKEYTYVIAAGATIEVFDVYNYFRVLSQTASSIDVIFGDNPNASSFSGAGIGIRFANLPSRLVIKNTGGVSTTLTFALAIGFIYDDRLNVSGTINIQGTVEVATPTIINDSADVAIAATTTTQVLAANAARKTAFISNLGVNNTVVRVGNSAAAAANGAELAIGGTAIISTTAALYVYNPSAGGINIGVMELEQ